MTTPFKRNDLVVFMTTNELPRVGLVTNARASKDHLIVYELGQRAEVHVSQVRRVVTKTK